MSQKQSQQVAASPLPPLPKRGEIWWVVQNPIIPNDPHLPRPALIISVDSRNRHWDSVVVVPFSTGLLKPHPAFHKLIPAGVGGLPKDSHARCDLVSNIEKSCLDISGPLGPVLPAKYMWEIVRGVRTVIGDNPDF